MDQMSASSVDNMIDLAISDTSGLSGLGHAFVDLDAKLTAWNKASTTEAIWLQKPSVWPAQPSYVWPASLVPCQHSSHSVAPDSELYIPNSKRFD